MPPAPSLVLAANVLTQIRTFFQDGGIFMYALALTSLVALAAIVFKILSLRRETVVPAQLERDVDRLDLRATSAGELESLLGRFRDGRSTLARLASVAILHRGRSHEEITEAVQTSARDEVIQLNAGMIVLDTIITVAPLFGLLGTASGLVVIFDGLGDTTDHSLVAKGIGRALDNTIVGLAIAVPAVVAHGWFSRRIEVLTSRLEVLLAKLARACEGGGTPTPGPR